MSVYAPRSAREVADAIGVTDRTIRRWIKAGKLNAEKRNGAYVIDIAEARAVKRASHVVGGPVDPEIEALRVIVEALLPLDNAARKRVLTYAQRRYMPMEITIGQPTVESHMRHAR